MQSPAAIRTSARTEYGLRALVDLAFARDGNRPVHALELAKSQGIPEDYLSQLLAVLRNGGLIKSIRGVGGGYVLARDPDSISVAEVMRLYEGRLEHNSHGCKEASARCLRTDSVLSEIWGRATEEAVKVLSSFTLKDVCDKVRASQAA